MNTEDSATVWAATLNMTSSRFPIVFTVLGFGFEPYRDHLGLAGDKQLSVLEFLAWSKEFSTETILITDLETCCLEPAHNNYLGQVRKLIMIGLDRGQRFILMSRFPRSRFPDVPGSSLLEDAKMHTAHLLESSSDDPAALPIYSSGGCTDTHQLFVSILMELGTDIIVALDHALFETFDPPADALKGLQAREVESLLCGGLVRASPEAQPSWAFPRRIGELKDALAEVISSLEESQTQVGATFALLFSLERRIRASMRTTAREVWGASWRNAVLNGTLPTDVLKRATADAYPGAKSLKELRDPLEWLTFSELLILRERIEFGSLGMEPVLWRRLRDEIVPIRNRMTHMRLLGGEDPQTVRQWCIVVRRKLS